MLTLATAQPARAARPTVKASSLAYLVFQRPDLDKAESFLTDFGLRVVSRGENALFFAGRDGSPYCYEVRRGDQARFVAFGFEVPGSGDLEALSALPESTPIEAVASPGGGERVVLTDPNGLRVEAVRGRRHGAPSPQRAALPLNTPERHPRINATQRPPAGPAEVIRLGHLVLEVADFQRTCA